MNAAPRVLFVMRRFWPLANDNVWRVMNVAMAMEHAGWEPHVLSAQWHSAWPQHVQLCEFAVHRLGPSPLTPFRSRRFTRAVCEWIGQHKSNFDCIVVDALEEESLAISSMSAADFPPVIVRYDSLESIGALQERLHARMAAACKQAAAVIVPHEHGRRELASLGVSTQRIALLPDGPPSKISRDEADRARARRALTDINHELYLRSDQRLCVCVSDLTKTAGIELLIHAIGPVFESRSDLRCWIIGDGPERSRLIEVLHRHGLRHEFLLPGTFGDLDVVLSVADLVVVPNASQGVSWLMPTSIVSGITTFTCDSPGARERFGVYAKDFIYERGNTQQLRDKFEDWIRRPLHWHNTTARAAERLLASRWSIEEWYSLLRRCDRSSRA